MHSRLHIIIVADAPIVCSPRIAPETTVQVLLIINHHIFSAPTNVNIMASGKPDPEAPSPTARNISVEDSKNPFVQFKHFADAQAGLVLKGMQAIIGLPSTLRTAEQVPGTDRRWNDWDEHMKQRDKSQYKGQQGTEQSISTSSSSSGDKDKPVSTHKLDDNSNQFNDVGTQSGCTLSKEERVSLLSMDDEGECDGLEIYMPVTRAIFGSLLEQWEDDVHSSSFGTFKAHTLPSFMGFLKNEDNLDYMAQVRSQVFEQLSSARSTRFLSTVPYLIFSPYSPLVLNFPMPVQSIGSRAQGADTAFPYAAAFQDLLLNTQGRDMQSLEDLSLTKRVQGAWGGWTRENASDDLVKSAMSWLGEMSRVGLLWKRTDFRWTDEPHRSSSEDTISAYYTEDEDVEDAINQIMEAHKGNKSSTTASSELDLYDMLLKAVNGKFPTEEEYKSMFSSLESSVKQIESDIKAIFSPDRVLGEPATNSQDDIFGSFNKQLGRMINEVGKTGAESKEEGSADLSPHSGDSLIASLARLASDAARTDKAEQEFVSSQIQETASSHTTQTLPDGTNVSTTERQYVDADGKLISSISVSKHYPDGTFETSDYMTTRTSEADCPGLRQAESLSDEDHYGLECPGLKRAAMANADSEPIVQCPGLARRDEERQAAIDEADENIKWLYAQLDEIERSDRLTPERRNRIRKNVIEMIESAHRVRQEAEGGQAEEVKAWEEEGRRIQHQKTRTERERERAAGVQQVRSKGKGWFWE